MKCILCNKELEKFKSDIGEKYHKFDLDYYHENAINYSKSKGAMYIDWLAAIRNWMLRDEKEGKIKLNRQTKKTKIHDQDTNFDWPT